MDGADASSHSCFIGAGQVRGLAGNGLRVPSIIHLHRPDSPQCYDLHVLQNLAPLGFSAPHHGPIRKVPPMRARFLGAPRIAELCTFTIVSAAFRARRFSCTCPLLCDFLEQGLWRLSRRLSRSLRKPAVCGGQHRACFSALVLLREQAGQGSSSHSIPTIWHPAREL